MPEENRRESDIVLIRSLDALIATVSESSRIQAESNKKSNDMLAKVGDSIDTLSKCVQELTQSEKVRIEKDKHQAIKNEKFEKHIEKYTEPLNRTVRFQAKSDKWGSAVGFLVILALAAAIGIDLKG